MSEAKDDLITRATEEAAYLERENCPPLSTRVTLRDCAARIASLTEQVERLTRERDYLKSGVNAVVNCQSALTRAQVREAMDDLLREGGWKAWGIEDQSPFVERALAAEAEVSRLRAENAAQNRHGPIKGIRKMSDAALQLLLSNTSEGGERNGD